MSALAESKYRESDMFDKAGAWIQNKSREIRKDFARNKFESEIQTIIKLANAHKAKGVKKGDEIYAELYQRVTTLVTRYTNDWGGSVQSILTNAPALRELKEWSEYDRNANISRYFVIAVVSFISASVACGLFIGIAHISNHMITFWIH